MRANSKTVVNTTAIFLSALISTNSTFLSIKDSLEPRMQSSLGSSWGIPSWRTRTCYLEGQSLRRIIDSVFIWQNWVSILWEIIDLGWTLKAPYTLQCSCFDRLFSELQNLMYTQYFISCWNTSFSFSWPFISKNILAENSLSWHSILNRVCHFLRHFPPRAFQSYENISSFWFGLCPALFFYL